jgi:hypothetical protein
VGRAFRRHELGAEPAAATALARPAPRARLTVRDLASGEPVPVAPIELPVRAPEAREGALTSDIALSPDGATLAALMGDPASLEIVAFDLATGAELLR